VQQTQEKTQAQELKRYRLSDSCPICHNVSKTCCNAPLYNLSDPFVLCADMDARKGVPGWKVTAPKSDKMGRRWWLYRPITADAKKAMQEALERASMISTETRRGRKTKSKIKSQPHNILSPKKRGRLANILRQWGFPSKRSEGYKDLLARGLTPEQIEQYHFIDLSYKMPMTGADRYKAGTYKWLGSSFWEVMSKGMSKPDYRYFIPVYDYQGRVAGMQVRIYESLRRKFTDKKSRPPKYVWTPRSKDEPWKGIRYSFHNEYDEPPLQTLIGEDHSSPYVLLVEGILKPLVLYERLERKYTVLGSSGGLFKSSPATMDDILRTLIVERDITHVCLVMDPGSAHNEQMMTHYEDAAEIIRSYGLEFQFIDYGQANDGDVPGPDEIAPNVVVEALPPVSTRGSLSARIAKFINSHAYDETPKTVDFNGPQVVPNAYDHNYGPKVGVEHINMIENDDQVLDIYRRPYRYILNRTAMGTGKSTIVPKIPFLHPEGRIWYITLTPRNPPTPEIESQFTLWPSRHDGLYIRGGAATPLGKDVLLRGEDQNTVGKTEANCLRAEEHTSAIQHGMPTGKICHTCPVKYECMAGIHEQYTYLFDKRMAGNAKKVRSSIQGINPDLITGNDILIIDEPPQSAKFVRSLEVKAYNVRAIKQALDAHFNIFWAFKSSADMELDLDEELDEAVVIEIDWDNTTATPEELEQALRKVDEILVRNMHRRNVHGAVPQPQGVELFKALVDPSVTVFRDSDNHLLAETRDERLTKILHNAGKVIFLDATAEPAIFAAQYSVPADDLVVIGNEDLAVNNVTVHVISTPGFNKKPDDSMVKERQQITWTVKEYLEQQYPKKVGFLNHGAYAEQGDLKLFSDSRGSNRLKDKDAACMFGLPQPHLIAAQQAWRLLKDQLGSTMTFNDYYGFLTHSEIKQAVGRLRGYRRNTPLTFYVVANVQLPRLEKEGYNVITTPGNVFGVQQANTRQRKLMQMFYRQEEQVTPWDDYLERVMKSFKKYKVELEESEARRLMNIGFSALLDSDRTNSFDPMIEGKQLDNQVIDAAREWASMPDNATLEDYAMVVEELSPFSVYQALSIYYDRSKPIVDKETRNWAEIILLSIFERRLKADGEIKQLRV
jgi:hypothetical protein